MPLIQLNHLTIVQQHLCCFKYNNIKTKESVEVIWNEVVVGGVMVMFT